MSTSLLTIAVTPLLVFGCASSAELPESNEPLPTPSDDLNDTGEEEDTNSNTDTDEPEDTGTPKDTSVRYTFSDAKSLLYVQVFKDPDTLLAAFAHNHVIRATNWTGELVYDPQSPSDCSLDFSLPVSGLIPDEDNMRDLVGYGDTISSSDRSTIQGHMLDTNQLNSSKFSKITFTSTKCTGSKGVSDGQLTVDGKITILGVPVSVRIPVDFEIKNDKFYASGKFDMSMWDFGMEPYSAFSGGVRNEEGLYYTFDMVGTAQ